jgi:hypothetical protein
MMVHGLLRRSRSTRPAQILFLVAALGACRAVADDTDSEAAAQGAAKSMPDAAPGTDGGRDGVAPPPDAQSDGGVPDFTHCDPGGPCPDLALDAPKLEESIFIESRDIDPTSCSVNEGTIGGGGRRRLLRFTTGAKNAGTADLFFGDPSKGDPKYFELAVCHGHYHFKGFADYQLLHADGSLAVKGHKMSFCIEDNIAPPPGEGTTDLLPRPNEVPKGSPSPPDTWTPKMRTYCHHPGLHMGWTDAYANTIEGNWIDITGVEPGDYVLSVTLNPERMIAELSYDNNHAEIPITVPAPDADGDACPANLAAISSCRDEQTKIRCVKGKTITVTCPAGTKCDQPEETAHPAKCFAPDGTSSFAPWSPSTMDDLVGLSEPGNRSLIRK